MTLFDDFFATTRFTRLEQFHPQLQQALQTRFWERKFGDWDNWYQAIHALPAVALTATDYQLDCDTLLFGRPEQLSGQQRESLEQALRHLHPWRKGPFNLFGIEIDTEWRSDWKWQRIQDYIAPLHGRTVLDVGCGSGYHCWRMLAAGAKTVVGIDPSPKFLLQFQVFKHYLPDAAVHYLPLRSEDMPNNMQCFDTVFSMGVLYHRKSPFEHLEELKQLLKPGGELVLETLVTKGDENTVLVPPDRYAQMPNVWCLPSPAALELWLKKLGFVDVRTVDVNITSCEEQRSTPWMTFQSLVDFLDPNDSSKTLEGLPAPTRAVVLARKPEN